MRRAIALASSGNFETVLEIKEFMQEVQVHLSMLNLRSKDMENKMSTLLSSIWKVEQACYKRYIRRQEFPEELEVPAGLLESESFGGGNYESGGGGAQDEN
jgi:hypothetical protein